MVKWNATKLLVGWFGLYVLSTCGALAAPVTYTFTASGPITGSLGAVPIDGSNYLLTFVFTGDTSNVVAFTSPVHGHEILVGTGTVNVSDLETHSVVAQGTFSAADNIFVSIDNVNGGVGFGSAGVGSSSPNFPGDPAYPLGIVLSPSDPIGYDLTSDVFITGSSNALSCLGFPESCIMPTPLATTAGNLVLGAMGGTFSVLDDGTFNAMVGSVPVPVPMPTPEPSTLVLLASGVALSIGFVRFKSRSNKGGRLNPA